METPHFFLDSKVFCLNFFKMSSMQENFLAKNNFQKVYYDFLPSVFPCLSSNFCPSFVLERYRVFTFLFSTQKPLQSHTTTHTQVYLKAHPRTNKHTLTHPFAPGAAGVVIWVDNSAFWCVPRLIPVLSVTPGLFEASRGNQMQLSVCMFVFERYWATEAEKDREW